MLKSSVPSPSRNSAMVIAKSENSALEQGKGVAFSGKIVAYFPNLLIKANTIHQESNTYHEYHGEHNSRTKSMIMVSV